MEIIFIGWCVEISLRSISIVDFKGFRFSKLYKRFGVKKVKKGIFFKTESIKSYFREQVRRALRKKPNDNSSFNIIVVVRIEMYAVVFIGGFTVNREF